MQAMAHLKLKSWAQAEADATSALEIDPLHFKSYQRRCVARLSMGKVRAAMMDVCAAEDSCLLAMQEEKDDSDASETMSCLLGIQKLRTKVEKALEDAAKRAPRRKITLSLVPVLSSMILLLLRSPAAAQLHLEQLNVGSHHKIVACRHGSFVINVNDSWIGRSLDVYGEWAEEEIALLSDFVKEGDVVADVGANIGTFAVPLARLVGASGKVVAFEPQRIISQLLSANLVLNEITNVGVYNAGVGNSDTPLAVPEIIYTDEGKSDCSYFLTL